MSEEQRADEMQVRALESAQTSGSNGRSGLSAQILPFAIGSRSMAVPELASELAAIQPHPIGDTPLSANVAYASPERWLGVARSWLSDAIVELEGLVGIASESGYTIPPYKSIERARRIATMCSHFGLAEPAFDVRENGEIEIFCREGSRGILMLIHPNEVFQIFGDFDADQWRARYNSEKGTWRKHLRRFLQELVG
jgi:hypothetical protein